ncbi:HVO_A0114 family putative DNA-binding protein [Methylobacterium sp. Gmos1]
MTDDLKIRIGGSAEDMGHRFIDAWHKAERGEGVPSAHGLTFENWDTFVATLSPARIALLKRLAADGPATSVNALAVALGRPYRRVHDDVAALHAAGLVERAGRSVALAVSTVSAHLDLSAA